MPMTDEGADGRHTNRRAVLVTLEVFALIVVVLIGVVLSPAFGIALAVCVLIGFFVGMRCCAQDKRDDR